MIDLDVLTIGDPHFKVNNVPESKILTFKLKQLATALKPQFIVILGDLLHRHEIIHITPLMLIEDLISSLSEIAPVYVLIGNHDRPNNNTFLTNEHPFNSLKRWSNVFIIDKTTTTIINNVQYTFVPYVSPGRFLEALNTNDNWMKSKAIFAHQEFKGAKMGAIVSKDGDVWPDDYPFVISGHIHDYDKLQNNITYIGTPYQHGFGDKQDKTVSIFNFTKDTIVEERHDLGLLKKMTFYLNPDELENFTVPTDKLVKLVIKGKDSEIKLAIHSDKVKKLQELGALVTFKTTSNQTKTPIPDKILKYKDRLYERIQSNTIQQFWFNKLFN